jgi:hypothetical protein
MMDLQ